MKGDSCPLETDLQFSRTGAVWTREATLDELGGPATSTMAPSIHADAFELHAFTQRSSLWQRGEQGWRLRFHKGTPTEDTSP
jgi:hypothetical protein